MECHRELEAFISQALLEVERDLSLPNNSLVDNTPSLKINREVTLKKVEVQLDQNFMASAWQAYPTFQGAKTPQKSRLTAWKNRLLLNAIDVHLDQ